MNFEQSLWQKAQSIGKGVINSLKQDSTLENLRADRLSVCSKCPLYTKGQEVDYCNPNLSINPETNETLLLKEDETRPGFYKGCGCTLNNRGKIGVPEKTTVIGYRNTCPAYKWNSVEKTHLRLKDTTHEINQNDWDRLGPTMYAAKYNLVLELNSVEAPYKNNNELEQLLLEYGFKKEHSSYFIEKDQNIYRITLLKKPSIFKIKNGKYSLIYSGVITKEVLDNLIK